MKRSEKLVGFCKKYYKEILVGIVITITVLIAIPYVIAWMHSFTLIITDTTNEWIGFWGGYLGAIIGGLITLYVMWRTIRAERNVREREERIAYFNNITTIWSELAKFTYDYHTCICRVEAEKNNIKNDYIERICEVKNKTDALKTQLEIILETRKNKYELNEIVEIVYYFGAAVEATQSAFQDAKKSKYLLKKEMDVLSEKKEKLEEAIDKMTDSIKETIVRNLY